MAYLFNPSELPKVEIFDVKLTEETKDLFYRYDTIDDNFVLNSGSWPRNDIALINEQTSIEAAKIMLDKLNVYPDVNPNVGLTDQQIMLQHRSKYCQAPSEVTSWIEKHLLAKEAAAFKTQLSEGSIDFNESDKDIVDNA